MQNNKFNQTGSFAPASANLLPSAEAQELRGPQLLSRETGRAPAPACPADKGSSLLGTRSKVSDCPTGTQRWETIRGMRSSTSLYTHASVFSLEIRFSVMNSQGFPCFSGQRNPGLTQQIMREAHTMGQRQALSPDAPGNTLGKSFIKQGTVILGTAVPAESRQ